MLPGWEDPCRRAWQPTPVFLPGEFHGQRSLVGFSPYRVVEFDTTEATTHTHTRNWTILLVRFGLFIGLRPILKI